ncbi:unnamed protein product [Prorocentrum cordatum]|uniref:SAM domain-containing protein n=1 Tax=Prorocentrum cordatum TaxID=2364126 RepID=A0ABN9XLZ2_9DINO|nr:unnamed protein product [Polarella glacialis]
MEAVREVLGSLRLERYAETFEEMGWDDLDIHTLDPEALRDLARDVGMRPGHASKFLRHFGGRECSEFGDPLASAASVASSSADPRPALQLPRFDASSGDGPFQEALPRRWGQERPCRGSGGRSEEAPTTLRAPSAPLRSRTPGCSPAPRAGPRSRPRPRRAAGPRRGRRGAAARSTARGPPTGPRPPTPRPSGRTPWPPSARRDGAPEPPGPDGSGDRGLDRVGAEEPKGLGGLQGLQLHPQRGAAPRGLPGRRPRAPGDSPATR